MYVCLCNGVTERDVLEAVEAGASNVEEVAYCTGAGTQCGSCVHRIAEMVGSPVHSVRDGCEGRSGPAVHLRVLTSAA